MWKGSNEFIFKEVLMKILEIIPFILILVGSIGLLLNEFIFQAGTAVVLVFAFLNLIGLAWLLVSYSRGK